MLRRGGIWERPSWRMCAGAARAGDSGDAEAASTLSLRGRPDPGPPARPAASAGAQESAVGSAYSSPPVQLFPRRDLKSPGTNWGAGSSGRVGSAGSQPDLIGNQAAGRLARDSRSRLRTLRHRLLQPQVVLRNAGGGVRHPRFPSGMVGDLGGSFRLLPFACRLRLLDQTKR